MVDCNLEEGLEATEPRVTEIRREWYWVKKGIEEILAEQPQLTFRPEDVYAECVNGNALLWVTYEGFVITTSRKDTFSGDETFLFWIAWAKQRGRNCVIKHLPFFENKAREAGFKYVELRTPIKELEEYFLKQDWMKDTVIYTRGL